MGAATRGKQTTYHAMTQEDIDSLVSKWADAAERIAKADADAIEIHVAHGYILGVFLNQRDNSRTDQYGGSLENRARLACEVISAVKQRVGNRIAILVRVAGEEYGQEGGLSLAESIAASQMFERAGADAIHVTGWGRNPFDNFTDGPLPNKVGAYLDNATEIKKHVGIPVIAVGRMLPDIAEEAIGDGRVDFAAMGRQLLADPELPNKLRAGTPEQVRPCINCYLCVAENFFDDTPFCAVNPALGNESVLPLRSTTNSKHVVVVGAGPSGMESARVLTERGHRVTIVDKADRLGGTMWFSTMTTPDNERLLNWLKSELKRLNVAVKLNTPATPELIKSLKADHVIVATGAVRPKPDIPGGNLPNVQTGDTLRAMMLGTASAEEAGIVMSTLGKLGKLSGMTKSPGMVRQITKFFLPMGKDVVVIGGSLVGLELSEFLAERGRRVTLLHEGKQLGLPLAMPRRWTAVKDSQAHGVKIHRDVEVTRINKDSVEWTKDGESFSAAASTVVYAEGTTSASPLADALEAEGVSVSVVGDANQVNYIHGAIHSSWKVATEL